MIMAVLALAGCDAGNGKNTAQQATQPAASRDAKGSADATAPPAANPKWFIQMNTKEAVSDTSAWLLERGYAPVIVVIDEKQQMLIGPYASEAEAEAQRVALQAKVAKSHRLAAPSVIQLAQ
jgi:hypothetical protein